MASNTIIVKSRSPRGFRRAGITFDRNGVELDTSKLKKGQLDAILNEPNLVVVEAAVKETAAERKAREQAEAEQAAAEKAEAEKAEAARIAAEKAEADKAKQ